MEGEGDGCGGEQEVEVEEKAYAVHDYVQLFVPARRTFARALLSAANLWPHK